MTALLRKIFPLLTCIGPISHASIEHAQLTQIQKSVERLVHQQMAGIPGKVSFTLGAIDARQNLPTCRSLEAFLPTGGRSMGNISVGVRCSDSSPWTIYVPVSIKVLVGVVVAARPLTPGRLIELADLEVQEADVGLLPAEVITETGLALGRFATMGVAVGQPLRRDFLRAPPVIQSGQSVTLRAHGTGFRVSAAGKAVNNAAEGQVAQVLTPSGHTVNGIARLGAIVDVQQ